MSVDSDLVELVESVLQMAEEEDSVTSEEALLTFLLDYLPADTLRALAITLGCDDEADETAVVNVLWEDRYATTANKAGEEEEEDRHIQFMCTICERFGHMTRHHLYPRELHGTYLKRKLATEAQLQETIMVCPTCHKTIHRFHSNRELAERYNTLEKLLDDEQIRKYAAWASRQSTGKNFRVK